MKMKQRYQREEKERLDDFQDENILSYMYKTKDHKAHDLRKRNDYLVGLIKN